MSRDRSTETSVGNKQVVTHIRSVILVPEASVYGRDDERSPRHNSLNELKIVRVKGGDILGNSIDKDFNNTLEFFWVSCIVPCMTHEL